MKKKYSTFIATLSDHTIPLSELEKVLPKTTYSRIVKNFILSQGFVNQTKFAQQNNVSKQFISHIIAGDCANTLCNMEVIKEDRTTYIKKFDENT